MHPDLLNNPTFLRYYHRWQANPTSAVFVGVADFFREYKLYDDALRVCEAGLQHNPELVSGHLVLARIYREQQRMPDAIVQLQWILQRQPQHVEAARLLEQMGAMPSAPEVSTPGDRPRAPLGGQPPFVSPTVQTEWATITMAELYRRQGHYEQAAGIYRSILLREPEHAQAREGLQSLMREAPATIKDDR